MSVSPASTLDRVKKRDCTIRVAKTKALISCAVTAQLICAFVFALQKSGFLVTRLKIFIDLALLLKKGIKMSSFSLASKSFNFKQKVNAKPESINDNAKFQSTAF